MDFKFRVNKVLESGLWWQVLLFSIINIIVFSCCMLVYFAIGKSGDIGWWDSLRLFIDSNSILDKRDPDDFGNVVLLATECLGTILFSGLIVSIITNVISLKVDSIKSGRVHYKLKNHVVVIGYDNIVPSIISEITSSPKYRDSKIILQTNESIDMVRSALLAKLTMSNLQRVTLIHAPRQSKEELGLLCTINARDIFIVGDRSQSDHDAENMNTFETLVSIHRKAEITKAVPLMIWFENEASYAALQLNDVSDEWKKFFDFKPYNFYKRWANLLLTKSEYSKDDTRIVYPEFDHKGITADSDKHVHLIIIGMNRMGTALAKEAAHLLHFPNFKEETGANKTRITFIDDNADREMNFFMGRLPGYFNIIKKPIYTDLTRKEKEATDSQDTCCKAANFLDIQFEFVKGRVESEEVREWIKKQLNVETAIVTIAICIHNPSQSFGMAMYLPEEVYTRGRDDLSNPWNVNNEDLVVNIFVRQEETGSLIKAFGDAAKADSSKNKRYANIYPFGMQDNSFSLDYHSNRLAMAFNYIYEYYFKYNNVLPDSLPDMNVLAEYWGKLSTALKWSNLYLADSIEFKLRSIGLTLEEAKYATISDSQIEDLAYTEHCRWNMEKLLMGYRTLTDKERNEKADLKNLKTNMFAHHLIKPYKDLTEDDKQLDRNIIKKLPDILRMLND